MTDIEIEFKDTKKGVELKIKGAPEKVEEYLEKYGYALAMKEAAIRLPEQAPTTPTQSTQKLPESIDIPEKPKAENLSQYITALMYASWGATGRTSTEIQRVATAHGIALPMSTLSGILNALTQSGKLRRTKHAGDAQWKYYPPLSVVTARE